MYMYYKNDAGKVEFRFGGEYPIRVTDIEGLHPLTRTFNTVSYADIDGVDTVSSVLGGRTVTVGGDILIRNKKFLSDVLRVLDKPGDLYMDFGGKRRKLICRSAQFSPGKRNAMYMSFVITFCSDKPYFYDFNETTDYVSRRADVQDKSFILPCVFTERVTENNIIVNGDAESEPIIEIICIKPADEQNGESGIIIENKSIGAKLEINAYLLEGEKITIDIESRKITSNLRGSMIGFISEDTFLNEFKLRQGVNHVKLINNNGNEQISAVCRYRCRYIEGVY